MVTKSLISRSVLTLAVVLVAGCGGSAVSPEAEAVDPGSARAAPEPVVFRAPATWVFVCGDAAMFVVRGDVERGTLHLPSGPVEVRGAGPGWQGGGWEIRIEGERATVSGDGRVWTNCLNDRLESVWQDARLRGVEFRAAGNEPGWYLELDSNGRAVLVTAYGAERHVFTSVRKAGEPLSRLTAEGSGRRLEAKIDPEPCFDAMSGETYPLSVRVGLDGDELRGCGAMLEPLSVP
ncbi:MAG: COG3650 family protein [Thermoanaerobaculia bacterium]